MATRETIAAQVHALHQELQQVHALLRGIAANLDIDVAPAPRHVTRDDGAVFLPGTGWTGGTSADAEVSDPDDGAPVVHLRAMGGPS